VSSETEAESEIRYILAEKPELFKRGDKGKAAGKSKRVKRETHIHPPCEIYPQHPSTGSRGGGASGGKWSLSFSPLRYLMKENFEEGREGFKLIDGGATFRRSHRMIKSEGWGRAD